jgi:hypothetical protein
LWSPDNKRLPSSIKGKVDICAYSSKSGRFKVLEFTQCYTFQDSCSTLFHIKDLTLV